MPSSSIERAQSPVFVVGCHRSGTNLLYDVLLSSGGFAVYRGYLPIYKMLIPRFGSMAYPENRRHIVETWLRSKGFRRSGLEAEQIATLLNNESRNGGDFIRIVMNEIAARQGMPRWAVYDPDNVLYMPEIKTDIPNALFVHIVRDGRDIAVSLRKMGEFRPIPWNRKAASLEATALYWRWMVETGRRHGQMFPNNYLEIQFERLVSSPETVLEKLGQFLGNPLDYARIQSNKLGRLSESNSSFRGAGATPTSSPINRWKTMLSAAEVADLEALVGECLVSSGYALTAPEQERKRRLRHVWKRTVYTGLLEAKLWVKRKTPAGRFSSVSALELADANGDAHHSEEHSNVEADKAEADSVTSDQASNP